LLITHLAASSLDGVDTGGDGERDPASFFEALSSGW
jgi:hypothetical protein